jgi:hypothetical protein
MRILPRNWIPKGHHICIQGARRLMTPSTHDRQETGCHREMMLLPNNLLPASVIAYLTCFVLTMLFLRGRTKLFDRIMVSSATTASGIWLYEIAYHYSWGLGGLLTDLSSPSVAIGGNAPFPIYFAVFLSALPLMARQYIKLNRVFFVAAAISAILFAAWLSLGFPQFWCVCASKPFSSFLLPGEFVKPDGWLSEASVEPLGYVMNSLTKLLAIVPAFLYYQDAKNTSKTHSLKLAWHDVFFCGDCHSWSFPPPPRK